MSRVAYITATSPFGTGEVFILNEMIAMKEMGVDLLVVPRDCRSDMLHQCGKRLIKNTLRIPRFNAGIALRFMKFIIKQPYQAIRIIYLTVLKSRNPIIALKNMIFLPKSVFLLDIMQDHCISHIHAHWGGTTSIVAYIVSSLTGIPWSFTLHRWDIKENNLLKDKVASSEFVRCISSHGKNQLLEILGNSYASKIKVIPMGVWYEEMGAEALRNKTFTVVTPANLIPVKGHRYLLEACLILKERGHKFKCVFYGHGYLKNSLERSVAEKGLRDYVSFPGAIPNERLIELYRNCKVSAVVLPSINSADGAHEGIPVSLMEAMSFGIPVISTDTGGIRELIGDGSGIMVEEKNGIAIANAIERFIKDDEYRKSVGQRGRDTIKRHFNVHLITKNLKHLFEINQGYTLSD